MEEKSNLTESKPLRFSIRKFKRNMRKSLWLPFIIVGVVVIAAGFLAYQNFSNSQNAQAENGVDTSVSAPLATQQLNRTYEFPLVDNEGEEVSNITYIIESAELQDEIIVRGQRAYAVEGRTFLILNIRIVNDYSQAIQINARDYIRLIVDGSQDRLAPDIHNDPVEIQAISTKPTRLGFPIDSDFESLTLQVGEINGDKQSINLDLK